MVWHLFWPFPQNCSCLLARSEQCYLYCTDSVQRKPLSSSAQSWALYLSCLWFPDVFPSVCIWMNFPPSWHTVQTAPAFSQPCSGRYVQLWIPEMSLAKNLEHPSSLTSVTRPLSVLQWLMVTVGVLAHFLVDNESADTIPLLRETNKMSCLFLNLKKAFV